MFRRMVDSTCSSVTEKRFWFSVHLMAMQKLPYKYVCSYTKVYYKCCGKNMQNDQKQMHVCVLVCVFISHELS